MVEMLKRKQAGLPARRDQPAPQPANVINLMDALKRSIAGERVATPTASAAPAASASKKGRKRAEGQREMLLPLPGNKPAKQPAAAKPVAKANGRQKKAG